MKHLAFFCLALILVTYLALVSGGVYAQQPPDWRPNIADDNKSATWEDTATFLSSVIKNKIIAQGKNDEANGWIFPLDIQMDNRCKLITSQANYSKSQKTLYVFRATADLSKVDPLSVTVAKVGQWWVVSMKGTDEGPFISSDGVAHKSIDLNVIKNGVPEALRITSCSVGEKACAAFNNSGGNIGFPFDDADTAKRVARALMHAALLCGGKKAVSPF